MKKIDIFSISRPPQKIPTISFITSISFLFKICYNRVIKKRSVNFMKGIGYCRVSTEEQVLEGFSLDIIYRQPMR